MESINEQNYREADHVLKLIVYLQGQILRPNEVKATLFNFLKTIMLSYQMINWSDR